MSITHPEIDAQLRQRLGTFLGRTLDTMAAAFARAERSHHRRLGFSSLTPEMLRDIRMAAEEAGGLPSQDPDLPFFMQPGFDRR